MEKLKCTTAILVGTMFLLTSATLCLAIDWEGVTVPLTRIGPMALLNPNEQYSETFQLNTAGIEFKSCHNLEYYQIGECNYLYKCYIILPEDCNDPGCAVDYYCTEITTLNNPELITVEYSTTLGDVGKDYAIAVFVLNSKMTYDWATQTWSDVTTLEETSKQSDLITIQGAPAPPVVDPLMKLGEFIQSIVDGIRDWLCVNLNLWCV